MFGVYPAFLRHRKVPFPLDEALPNSVQCLRRRPPRTLRIDLTQP